MAAAETGCPFLDEIISGENTTPCIITSLIKILDVLMMTLAPDFVSDSGYTRNFFLSHCKPYEEGPVQERIYKFTFMVFQRDAKKDIILSEDRHSRMNDLLLNGGDAECRLSFSFYDLGRGDEQDLMSLNFKMKDLKSQAFLGTMIRRLINASDGLPIADHSPTRTIVERHFQYRPKTEEEGESSHRDVLQNRVCDWTTVKITTPQSRDDVFNFVYGDDYEEKTILYYGEPKRHRRMTPKEEFFIFSKIVGDALV